MKSQKYNVSQVKYRIHNTIVNHRNNETQVQYVRNCLEANKNNIELYRIYVRHYRFGNQ